MKTGFGVEPKRTLLPTSPNEFAARGKPGFLDRPQRKFVEFIEFVELIESGITTEAQRHRGIKT